MKKETFLSLAIVLLYTVWYSTANAQSVVKIAAAANLRYALEEIEAKYEAENKDTELQINYGSSGMFFQQISSGAPYNLFLSADEGFPTKLKEAGRNIGEAEVYACGKLALYALNIDSKDLTIELLTEPSVKRIAIANPRTAPYGDRSVELLKKIKVWDDIQKKVIYGESISQTAQFATTGNTDVGFVALSLLLNPNETLKGNYYIIPQELYTPIAQAGILVKQNTPCEEAKSFFEYILSPACNDIWNKYGYSTMQ